MIRTGSKPPAWLVAQRWEQLLFAHWPIEPARLRPFLPLSVEPDVREGEAWVAFVAFVMVGTRASGPPWWPVLRPIPELNLRTYVRVNDVPAVWFLSCDAASPFFATIGRALYGLPYRVARMRASGGSFESVGPGGTFSANYEPVGPAACARPGSLEHFLVERYRLFSQRRGRLIAAEVAHEPWPLQPAAAKLELQGMAPFELRGDPLLHFSCSVTAVISAPSVALLQSPTSSLNAGSSRIASKSESPFA